MLWCFVFGTPELSDITYACNEYITILRWERVTYNLKPSTVQIDTMQSSHHYDVLTNISVKVNDMNNNSAQSILTTTLYLKQRPNFETV